MTADTRRWLYLVAALAAALLLLAGFSFWRGDSDGREGRYVTETVDSGAVEPTVTATGTVNPVTTVQVGTYVSGPIQELDVDFNSHVTKGQRVAKIDPALFLVKVKQAEASLATARARANKSRADLQLKKLTLERNRELRKKTLISQNDLDTAETNHAQAIAQLELDEAGVQQAEAALAEAKINLSYTEITSPVDGVVVSRNVDVGQTVAASFQTPTLFQIAQDLTKMQVDSNVSESDIGAVREGQEATFTVDAYPGRPFEGTVSQVRNAPITVQNVVTYDVVVAVDNSSLELKPGMTATVTIITARRDDVVRIPLRALRFTPPKLVSEAADAGRSPGVADADEGVVWVLSPEGKVVRKEIRTGLRDEQYAELTSGEVRPGDAVAVSVAVSKDEDSEQLSPFAIRRRR